jgi:hypothetical protein
LARASRKAAGPALDANMCFMLASQAVLPAVTDRAVILDQAAALMLAAGLVTSGFMALPPIGDRRAARAARAVGADLLRMVRRRDALDPAPGAAGLRRQVLRLALHLERVVDLGAQAGWSLPAALNLGEAIGRLQGVLARPGIDAGARRAARDARDALEGLLEDPAGAADRLEGLAGSLPGPEGPGAELPDAAELAEILRDAAAAIRACRALLARAGARAAAPPAFR